jgi:lysozyme
MISYGQAIGYTAKRLMKPGEAIVSVYTEFDGALLGSIMSFWFADPLEKNGPMRWPELVVKLIALFEGCEKKGKDGKIHPYLDKLAKPPVWTRAYGRTYGISKKSEPVSPGQALDELRDGIKKYGGECLKMAPGLAMKDQCFAAVASWSWNCGLGAFRVSRLRKAINEGRWMDAANHIRTPRIAEGVVYRGLVRRRDAEEALFRSGIE